MNWLRRLALTSKGNIPNLDKPVEESRIRAREHQKFANSALAAGDFALAEQHSRAAIALTPEEAAAHLGLGVALYEQDALDQAEIAFVETARLSPQSADSDYFLASIAFRRSAFGQALSLFQEALRKRVGFVQALEGVDKALRGLGSQRQHCEVLERLARDHPDWAECQFKSGVAWLQDGEVTRGLPRIELALSLDEGRQEFRLTLANALLHLQRYPEVLATTEPLLSVPTAPAATYLIRARALHASGQHDLAATAALRSESIAPLDAEAPYTAALALTALHRWTEIIDILKRLLARHPGFKDARYRLAVAYANSGQTALATEVLRLVIKEAPDTPFVFGDCAMGAWTDLDWSDHAQLVTEICRRIDLGQPAAKPFDFMLVSDSCRLQQLCARLCAPAPLPPLVTSVYTNHERIRVAYLSPDFRNHAIAFLLTGVVEAHDRSRFETIGVSWGKHPDEPTGRRIRDAFERYFDVTALSDDEIAMLLKRLEVDIAVDLAGLTRAGRPGIFVRRGAAIQVNYLGHPGTLGIPAMDYIIADRYIIPPTSEVFYEENVVRLPYCFQANDSRRPRPTGRVRRQDIGLPDGVFVFCSMHSSPKLSPNQFRLWTQILAATPGSVLMILCTSTLAKENLFRESERAGLSTDRLVLREDNDYEGYLNALSNADLVLDTLPFNGGTSASDALWVGVPVVTRSGEAFASRMAGSLLTAIGLEKLIANSSEDYVACAARLATDAMAYRQVKQQVVRAAGDRLFSSEQFCVDLEAAFAEMWHRSARGESAARIDL